MTVELRPTAAGTLVEAVRRVCPDAAALRNLHEPIFEGREEEYVRDCVRTGWVSSVGAYVDRFEADLARATGVARAIAVVNGTAALQVALELVGVGDSDEVLMPTLTFVGTANAVRHAGGIPHFVDSHPTHLGMDAAKLQERLAAVADVERGEVRNRQTGRRIGAVLPVHIYGHPVDLDPLLQVCREWGLPLVEDAAESLGSYYKGRHTGGFGRVAAISFNGNKIVTTGGGGAVLTDDLELAARAKHLTTTGKKPHPWRFDHDVVAWNYRMPNLNAALGCAQLERLADFVTAKRKLAERYADAFADEPEWSFVPEPEGTSSNYWLNVVSLKSPGDADLNEVLAALHQAGISARPVWTLMHELPMYREAPRTDLPVAEDLARRLINLPSGIRVARACD